MIVIVVSHQRIGKTAERKLFRFIAFIEEIKMTNKRTVYGKKLLTASVLVSMLPGGACVCRRSPSTVYARCCRRHSDAHRE